jgi:hypothetical protein
VIITAKQKFKPKRIMLVRQRQATGFICSALPAPLPRLIRKYRPLAHVEENWTSRCRGAGSSAAGWIIAHAEYCRYGDYISVEKCGIYEAATLMSI